MIGRSAILLAQPGQTAQFFLAAPVWGFQMAVEPIAVPFEFGAQSAFEAEHAADAIDIKIRACRQQHQMIARRAVCLQNAKRERPELVPGFQSADKGFGPRIEHLRALAPPIDHANDA